jgi:hypothetical protein
MNEQSRDELYYSTNFAKRLEEIRNNPDSLKTKKQLVDFWSTAIEDRNKHKEIQEFIATEAARELGNVDLDELEDKKYLNIIDKFLILDHMYSGHPESDEKWHELTEAVESLK